MAHRCAKNGLVAIVADGTAGDRLPVAFDYRNLLPRSETQGRVGMVGLVNGDELGSVVKCFWVVLGGQR